MLLLTNILRSRYRGAIYFHPAEADRPPEIEFSEGEGPEQVMNQIQDYAVPEIRKSIEPLGPYLRWEELDLEAGVVRRHLTRFHDRFEFVLCPDELGIELVLPLEIDGSDDGEVAPEGGRRNNARPWVPLRRLAEPGGDPRGLIGWSVERPELRWRYLQTRYAPPAIEITWSCASLPAHWAAQVLAERRHLDCRLDDDRHFPMHPTRDGLLVYRGCHPLAEGSARPATLAVQIEQPLVVTGPTRQQAPDDGEERHELSLELPATVDALDFRALIDGRPTHLVTRADLDRGFEAEVWTAGDVLLPEMIPAGAIPGLPWDLEASETHDLPPAVERHDGKHRGAAPEASSRRRWRLAPRVRDRMQGRWLDLAWEHDPPALAFGLGSFDASRAPRITHIENRRASVAWRIEANDEGGNLCLCVPHWVPVGCPGRVALPARDGSFEYATEVRARLDGLEERFVIDQRSEVSPNRLFLGPRRWNFRDQQGGAIAGGEALGEGAGCVRWRRATGNGEDHGLKPTDWAGGSAPVLLLNQDDGNSLDWGGLYAPAAVPWDALEEVTGEPATDPAEILLVPRSPAHGAAIWIDLWGFICRYDVHRVAFTRSHGQTSEPTAWIARAGLELFPRHSRHLLRSFSPIYAVRDRRHAGGAPAAVGPRSFSLRPTSPRPTLHIGRELDAGNGSPGGGQTEHLLMLEIGPETYLRWQLAAPGRIPQAFEPGRVPGTRLRLDRIGRRVVWIAVEQRRGEAGRRAGYLLSWDAAGGWLFRGFYAHQGAAVELGQVRRADLCRRVFLGSEGSSRTSSFRLTIDRQGDHWSDTAPAALTRELTPDLIRAWEIDHFAPERRPIPLQGHGMRILQQSAGDQPWIFEFFDGDSRAASPPAGIRVWQLHGQADEYLAGGARELGADPAEEAGDPEEPARRILRADDDDDF